MHGETEAEGPWRAAISLPSNNEVELQSDPGTEKLSEVEEQLIEEVFANFGKRNRWQLRDLTHNLPEWHDPNGSSIRIEYKDILFNSGKTEEEIESILEEIESLARMDEYLNR
jgi:hypothetical protein